MSRVALLADTNDLAYRQAAAEVEAAARTLGAQLRRHAVSSRHELNGVFATMVKEGAGAVVPAGEPARRHRNSDVGRAWAGQCNANDFTAPRAPFHSIPLT